MSTPSKEPNRKPSDDDALAWALVAAASSHLSRSEADRIHICIGVDETFTAIDDLITAIVRNQILLPKDLVAGLVAWLDCYHGQPDEPRLRELLAEVTTVSLQQMSPLERRPASGL